MVKRTEPTSIFKLKHYKLIHSLLNIWVLKLKSECAYCDHFILLSSFDCCNVLHYAYRKCYCANNVSLTTTERGPEHKPYDFFCISNFAHDTHSHSLKLRSIQVSKFADRHSLFSEWIIPIWNLLPDSAIIAKNVTTVPPHKQISCLHILCTTI